MHMLTSICRKTDK